MPLVLATGAATESGHSYADVLGSSYEYPKAYRNLIQSGELFVYYRGRRVEGGGTRPQVYLGCGTIGEVTAGSDPNLLRCDIPEFSLFAEPVGFRKPDGTYLEPAGIRRGYFQAGVRRIDQAAWEQIVQLGQPASPATPTTGYASAVDARQIEKISRQAALDWLRARDDVLDAVEMPYNNPGYDIHATTSKGPLYVEVKGTSARTPGFFLSEGERRFAAAHPDRYLLIVVTEIDLESGSSSGFHLLTEPPDVGNAALRPHQWRGDLQ